MSRRIEINIYSMIETAEQYSCCSTTISRTNLLDAMAVRRMCVEQVVRSDRRAGSQRLWPLLRLDRARSIDTTPRLAAIIQPRKYFPKKWTKNPFSVRNHIQSRSTVIYFIIFRSLRSISVVSDATALSEEEKLIRSFTVLIIPSLLAMTISVSLWINGESVDGDSLPADEVKRRGCGATTCGIKQQQHTHVQQENKRMEKHRRE